MIKLLRHFAKLKIYAFRLWITTTRSWGRPMQRRRIFGVAINLMTHHLREPMHLWTRLLRLMATALQARASVSLRDCLLPETHPALELVRRSQAVVAGRHRRDLRPGVRKLRLQLDDRLFKGRHLGRCSSHGARGGGEAK